MDILKDLFLEICEKMPEGREAEEEINSQIETIMEAYDENRTYDRGEIRDLLFSTAYYAKKEYFVVGFQFAIKLLGK